MQGLTASEVKARTEAGLSNIQVDTQTRTVKEIVKGKVFTYFNLIFVVLGVLLILVGSFKDLTFLLIAAANTGVGIFQEIRSKNKLDQLRFLKMPRAHAIRDGAETEVPVETESDVESSETETAETEGMTESETETETELETETATEAANNPTNNR